jgi:aspartate racemase
VAQQLAAQGREVSLLALFDTWGKGYPRLLPFAGRMMDHLAHLGTLGFAEQFAYATRKALGVPAKIATRIRNRTVGGVPSAGFSSPSLVDADDDNVGLINHLAWRRYQPRPYHGRLVLFRAAESPRWIGSRFDDPLLGWGELAAGGIEVHTVPGDHLTLLSRSNAPSLARGLAAYLRN